MMYTPPRPEPIALPEVPAVAAVSQRAESTAEEAIPTALNQLVGFGTVKKSSLGPDFQPNNWTVVCGKFKRQKNSYGNRRWRVLAGIYLDRYAAANTRTEKTNVVSIVVETIRSAGGSFVRRDEASGKWFEIGDASAREKTGALFRDCLSERYSSSSKQKSAKRRRQSAAATGSSSSRRVRRQQTSSANDRTRLLPGGDEEADVVRASAAEQLHQHQFAPSANEETKHDPLFDRLYNSDSELQRRTRETARALMDLDDAAASILRMDEEEDHDTQAICDGGGNNLADYDWDGRIFADDDDCPRDGADDDVSRSRAGSQWFRR